MSVSILGRRSSGMKKQRCSGFKRLIVATQGDGSAWTAISKAFVVVSAATRRTIGSCRAATPSHPSPLEGEGQGGGQPSRYATSPPPLRLRQHRRPSLTA